MIHVRLDQFEGPLGLLLYLIRKDEMDIYNIPIQTITTQYLEHLKHMRELDLEVAGEFVAMAATLILIKSKMLLPQYNENGELVEATEDPRKELVQRLLEYQMYQAASKELNDRPLLGRDVWARGTREEIPTEEGDIIVDEGGLFALISIYRKVMKQVHKNVHNVRAKGQSIAARILEIKDRLIPGTRVTLQELMAIGESSANQVLITFLSLLELTKMGFTTLFQTENYGDIYVDTKKVVERNVIDRVEEYDRRPEDLAAVAAGLEADAGGRNLQEIGYEAAEIAAESDGPASSDPQFNLGEQMGLDTFAPSEQVASDDDILAAEAEMGVTEAAVDMNRIDQILANFTMEAEAREPAEVIAAVPFVSDFDESTLADQELVVAQDPQNGPELLKAVTDQEFDSAWETAFAAQGITDSLAENLPVESPSVIAAEPVSQAEATPAEAKSALESLLESFAKFEAIESEPESEPSLKSALAATEVLPAATPSGDGLVKASVSGPATDTASALGDLAGVGEASAPQVVAPPETAKAKVSFLAGAAKASLSLFDDEPEDFVIDKKPELDI